MGNKVLESSICERGLKETRSDYGGVGPRPGFHSADNGEKVAVFWAEDRSPLVLNLKTATWKPLKTEL